MAKTVADILADRCGVSEEGRKVLAAAVSIDHNWVLPASSADLLIAALDGLSEQDLEAASLLAYHLQAAITCRLIDLGPRPSRLLWEAGLIEGGDGHV